MAENEKDVPIKEREDGSVLAKLDFPDEIEGDEEEKEPEAKKELESEDAEDDAEEDADDDELAESEEEREKIREARREERRLKKDLKRQRDLSSKHKITTLERRNEELARRLAAVESTAASYQFAQLDKQVGDEATRVEYAKMRMIQAAQTGDAAGQVEYLEQLTDAKQRLQQIEHYRKQQIEQAKAPKQNVPNEISTEVQANATKWLKKNNWYDPQARDTDSRIAKLVDQELATDGWDPSDPEYWDELDSRLSSRLPHRYTAQGGKPTKRAAGPTASSRVSSESSARSGTITLSRERVQAIKDAGSWDDTAKRNKMIRAYATYDRANRG